MEKRTFTRVEKIAYYQAKIEKATRQLAAMKARLAFIQSDAYQNWESDLEKELKALKSS